MDIRILPSNIANMIAAGEVVQRPASVVKELMENAVDAGAQTVTVVISDAGRTLIQVIDDGCGMSPDEAVLCFERHATSKIATAEDLSQIMTFGFRGEALASIAAVAEVTLKTRREEDETGCEVVFADSKQVSAKEVSAPKGSNFAVRNLFYNVPARRKFLKSENVEMKHIVSEFIKVALTRPDINFSLTHGGREVYVLKKAKSLKFRIQDILGSQVTSDVMDLSARTSVVNVTGFIGRPESAKKSQLNQYFFVNGRYFRSPYLHKAVMKAYDQLIPDGTSPAYFIYLEVDPQTVDVNIHPTKTEIKFEEDSVIFQILYAGVKESLGRNSFSDAIDFDRGDAPEMPVMNRKFRENSGFVEPKISADPTYNPFDNDGFPSETSPYSNSFGMRGFDDFDSWKNDTGYRNSNTGYRNSEVSSGTGDLAGTGARAGGRDNPYSGGWGGAVDRREDYGKLFEEKTLPSSQIVIFKGKYIILHVKSGLMVINIRRAQERLLYEQYLKALSSNGQYSGASLFPVQVNVGAENVYILREHAELLESMGFRLAEVDSSTVEVKALPEGYSSEPAQVEKMLYDLILALSDGGMTLRDDMMAELAAKFAKIGAMNSVSVRNPIEAQRLIDDLFACESPQMTHFGKKTMVLVPEEELDKLFN